MPKLNEDKVALYRKLTEEINEVDENHQWLKYIIKANHKSIRDLRDDIDRWKETCLRQSDKIHRLYLICTIQCLVITGLSIWVSIAIIFQ